MDDLGDDSVQLVVRVSREAFELWMRNQGKNPTREKAASRIANALENGEVRVVEDESESLGWKQVTLDAGDLDGIKERLEGRGVEFMVNERLDGDIDLYFKASSEEAIKEALADIIASEAFEQTGDERTPEVAMEVESEEAELTQEEVEELSQCVEDAPDKDEKEERCDPIEAQIEEPKASEASREDSRADGTPSREVAREVGR